MVFRTASHMVLPSDKRSWMFRRLQYHSIEPAPPFVTQTGLQQHRRCSFFHSAHCSFGSPICFWSSWRWRDNVSRIILRKTCQSPRNCQCKWLLVFSSAPGTSLRSSGSPEKFFCFARVWWYPLSCQILYHHGILMIVPRCTSFTENFEICSLSSHQNFPLWARLYQYVFCKKPLLFSSSK